MSTGVHHKITN